MTSHPQQHLDIYKLLRESIDVEALAQELARYLQMAAEDSEVLSQDVTRRNELIGELYKRPGVEPYHPHNFVPPGGEPDAYLVPANAEIAKLTPPKSFEEHVERFHLIFPALMIFNRYKVGFALRDHPDLERKVVKRKRELMEEWRWNVFDVRFPGRIKAGPRPSSFKMPSTPSTPARIPTPPPYRYSTKEVSEDESTNFLANPHTMVGKPFFSSPPQDQAQEYRGTWEVISLTVKKADAGVEHQYQVLLEAFDGVPLPMDKEDIRDLLRYSTELAV